MLRGHEPLFNTPGQALPRVPTRESTPAAPATREGAQCSRASIIQQDPEVRACDSGPGEAEAEPRWVGPGGREDPGNRGAAPGV